MVAIGPVLRCNSRVHRLTDLSLEDAALFLGVPLLGVVTVVAAYFVR